MCAMNGFHHSKPSASSSSSSSSSSNPYAIRVKPAFLITVFLFANAIAGFFGNVCLWFAMRHHVRQLDGALQLHHQQSSNEMSAVDLPLAMPSIPQLNGKSAAGTVYTARDFRQSKDSAVRTSSFQHMETTSKKKMMKHHTDAIMEDIPSFGQHLIMDWKHVDSGFLDSEDALAQSIVEFFARNNIQLQSYHCHSMQPTGVSCAGISFKTMVSFHTWPDDGVMTWDFMTFHKDFDATSVVPLAYELFAPRQKYRSDMKADGMKLIQEPVAIWSATPRGFPSGDNGIWGVDLGLYHLASLDLSLKHKIAHVETDFQDIDIYDIIHPKRRSSLQYDQSMTNSSSYEFQHPEQFQPNRYIYLNGIIQSTRFGDEAYHETLVHPALFLHNNPKRVGIVGGGEGATLREILKHETVEKCVMVEIDSEMIETSRKYIPSWSDCRDIEGLTDSSCFDDVHTDLYTEDALAWWINRFGDDMETTTSSEPKFDVIVFDALDPGDDVPFAEILYKHEPFFRALMNSLTEDGIMVMQLGEASTYNKPPDQFKKQHNRANLLHMLEMVGFKTMHTFEEGHGGFYGPWEFAIACKTNCDEKWYRSSDRIEKLIHHRIRSTISGQPTLKFFDGATMSQFQFPPRSWEDIYCRHSPQPKGCDLNEFDSVVLSDYSFPLYNPLRDRKMKNRE